MVASWIVQNPIGYFAPIINESNPDHVDILEPRNTKFHLIPQINKSRRYST
jgi:hypothetical protein